MVREGYRYRYILVEEIFIWGRGGGGCRFGTKSLYTVQEFAAIFNREI